MATSHHHPIAREHRPMTGMDIVKKDKRVLIISHGNPTFSLGGGEVASYNLFNGIHVRPGWESFFLARVGPPVNRHKDSALMCLRQKEREIRYYANDYDHFRCSNRNLPGLQQDFVRYVVDLQPDVINFHHYIGLGVEAIFALKQALPRVPIVITFHEYLSICHHHGQMVKTSRNSLCYRSSPAECTNCFPAGSAGGISPPAAHRTVRKPLDLHGSSQPLPCPLAMTVDAESGRSSRLLGWRPPSLSWVIRFAPRSLQALRRYYRMIRPRHAHRYFPPSCFALIRFSLGMA